MRANKQVQAGNPENGAVIATSNGAATTASGSSGASTASVPAAPASLGRAFESAAADWMAGRGYSLLERNYTIRGGEIDLIFDFAGKTVFAEVKARSDGDNLRRFGPPSAAVNAAKQSRLIHAAECYLRAHPERTAPRLDVIEITYSRVDGFYFLHFHHIPAAFVKKRSTG